MNFLNFLGVILSGILPHSCTLNAFPWMQPVWTCGATWKVNVAFDILGWKIVFLIYEIYLSISAFKWSIQLQLPSWKPQMTQMTKCASQREIQVINNATFFLIFSYFTSVYRFKCNYSCLINRNNGKNKANKPCFVFKCINITPQKKKKSHLNMFSLWLFLVSSAHTVHPSLKSLLVSLNRHFSVCPVNSDTWL